MAIPQQYRRQPTRETDNLALSVERSGADNRHGCLRNLEGGGRVGHLCGREKSSGERQETAIDEASREKNWVSQCQRKKNRPFETQQRQQTNRGAYGGITTLIEIIDLQSGSERQTKQ
jgi:hypothetical protein